MSANALPHFSLEVEVCKDNGGKKLDDLHSLKHIEMAECSFQPQQWPRSCRISFSLEVKDVQGDWRQEVGRSTLSLKPNELAECSLPFGFVRRGRADCRVSPVKEDGQEIGG